MDPNERLSAAFATLRQAIQERDNAWELKQMQLREKAAYFEQIKTAFIVPTFFEIAAELEANDCRVDVSENPAEITFDLDAAAPDALPWRFRIDYDPAEDVVNLTYSDIKMNKRDLCVKVNGPMLYDLTDNVLRVEIENFVISVLDLHIAAILQETPITA